MRNVAKDILFGIATGDALGVPFEFSTREKMRKFPAKDVVGYLTHNQPPGTWSDDSSLTFCLAEALIDGYSLTNTAEKFIKWKNDAYWTARGEVFDIGMTTAKAISRLESIIENKEFDDLEFLKYNADEYDNGNGSLMRILPLIFEVKGKTIAEQFEIIWNNSALTHRHIRSAMSCLIYLKLAEYLIEGRDRTIAYNCTRKDISEYWNEMDFDKSERIQFRRVIDNDISSYSEDTILSGGYVIESLEVSLWCLLKTDSYESAVLKAINFGQDTDTTAAITGGLASIHYGFDSIPRYWVASLAKMEEIEELSEKLNKKYNA